MGSCTQGSLVRYLTTRIRVNPFVTAVHRSLSASTSEVLCRASVRLGAWPTQHPLHFASCGQYIGFYTPGCDMTPLYLSVHPDKLSRRSGTGTHLIPIVTH